MVEYLRQKSRSFIFNTAPTPSAMAAADEALSIIETEPWRVEALHANISLFASEIAGRALPFSSKTAIFPIAVGDERKAVGISKSLEKHGFLVPAIRYPTVAKGQARLRAAINAGHNRPQLESLAALLAAACSV